MRTKQSIQLDLRVHCVNEGDSEVNEHKSCLLQQTFKKYGKLNSQGVLSV